MSVIGEVAFINLLREKIADEIDIKSAGLVSNTTERNAGVIQGLQRALAITTELYEKLSEGDRPKRQQE